MAFQHDSIHDQKAADQSIARIKELIQQGVSQHEMVEILNREGYTTLRQKQWTWVNIRQVLWRLRSSADSWYKLSSKRCGLEVPPAARSMA